MFRRVFAVVDSPATILGGIALILTAIGGLITAIAGLRRGTVAPSKTTVPSTEEVWVETLFQLEQANVTVAQRTTERDKAVAERDALVAEVADAHRDTEFYRTHYEEANAERLELLRLYRPAGGSQAQG